MDTACPKQVRLGGFDVNEYLALHLVSVFSSNAVPVFVCLDAARLG